MNICSNCSSMLACHKAGKCARVLAQLEGKTRSELEYGAKKATSREYPYIKSRPLKPKKIMMKRKVMVYL